MTPSRDLIQHTGAANTRQGINRAIRNLPGGPEALDALSRAHRHVQSLLGRHASERSAELQAARDAVDWANQAVSALEERVRRQWAMPSKARRS
ncbi:MAG TPA: hypothetical protein VMW52_00805 [Phycisphaerae bacterium]|nr:hypothetical protein [Phycisphaerae bacterium]